MGSKEIEEKAFLAKALRRKERPQRTAGNIQEGEISCRARQGLTNIEQSSAGCPDIIKSAGISLTGRPLVTPG
jgi:hypothetical protein